MQREGAQRGKVGAGSGVPQAAPRRGHQRVLWGVVEVRMGNVGPSAQEQNHSVPNSWCHLQCQPGVPCVPQEPSSPTCGSCPSP